jgi:hypothetical protein
MNKDETLHGLGDFDAGDEQQTIEDALEQEVIIAESAGGEAGSTRTIRVYDKARGDFTLEIPSESTVTFGYFNPAAASDRSPNYDMRGAGQTLKATALRIYKTHGKSSQLACFIGTEGFRDLSLKLTRLRQRVVIESNFEDDGDGNQAWRGSQQKLLNRAAEDGDEDIPF